MFIWFASTTTLQRIFSCNGAKWTILGGNERRKWLLSNNAKLDPKDGNDAIVQAIWIDIFKYQINIGIIIFATVHSYCMVIQVHKGEKKQEKQQKQVNKNVIHKYECWWWCWCCLLCLKNVFVLPLFVMNFFCACFNQYPCTRIACICLQSTLDIVVHGWTLVYK